MIAKHLMIAIEIHINHMNMFIVLAMSDSFRLGNFQNKIYLNMLIVKQKSSKNLLSGQSYDWHYNI